MLTEGASLLTQQCLSRLTPAFIIYLVAAARQLAAFYRSASCEPLFLANRYFWPCNVTGIPSRNLLPSTKYVQTARRQYLPYHGLWRSVVRPETYLGPNLRTPEAHRTLFAMSPFPAENTHSPCRLPAYQTLDFPMTVSTGNLPAHGWSRTGMASLLPNRPRDDGQSMLWNHTRETLLFH